MPSRSPISNDLGICTVSLGTWQHHSLIDKLKAASRAGYRAIDLFDEDWAHHLKSEGIDSDSPWDPTPEKLQCASRLASYIKELGMYIACTQPLRSIEGILDAQERAQAMQSVANRFPFMRAFDTDLVFMCATVRTDPGVTIDFQTVVRDLRELSDMAAAYSHQDGGKMLRIGYEGLSWAQRNTWSSTWEVVRAVHRPNFGLIADTFNMLAVEFADPYASSGNGLFYPTMEEALDVLSSSLSAFVASVPGDKIFLVQVADAQLVDPNVLPHVPPLDNSTPRLLPWSRGYRLYPMEQRLGGYLPIDVITKAVLATGYEGPLTLEVFSKSLHSPDRSVPIDHAERGFQGLSTLLQSLDDVPESWSNVAPKSRANSAQALVRQRFHRPAPESRL